jgi:poly(3-hydroxyalkanoate) synthetase
MNDILLTGIITLIGVSIGGIFTLLATNLTQKNEQKTKDLQNLISQWETFHEIEKELINKIVELDNTQNVQTIKNVTRATIYSRDFEDLDTPGKIKSLKKKWK